MSARRQAEYLSFMGYQVLTAPNGLVGLELAAAHHPDVRVIVVTGHGMRGTHPADRELACDAYFLKPCLPEDLHAEIQSQLRARAA